MTDTFSVPEAAAALGISTDAVRKRLSRGTLHGVKDDQGQWQITLDEQVDKPLDTPDATGATMADQVIEDLRTRLDKADARVDVLITDLRSERERSDMLQAMNVQARDRIRELEALTEGVDDENEVPAAPTSPANSDTGISTHVDEETQPAGAWARFRRWIAGE